MRASLVILALVAPPAFADQPGEGAPVKQPAIPKDVAARLPDPGKLVAYGAFDAQQTVIARITKTGPKEMSRFSADGQHAAWLDARTYVAIVDDGDHNIAVHYYVDGVLDPKRELAHRLAAWKLKKGEEIHGVGSWKTADNQLWLSGCLKPPDGPEECTVNTWLRVDANPPVAARTKPAKLTALAEVHAVPPDIKAPAGFTAKLTKVKGADALECVGPGGKATWELSPDPAYQFAAKKLHWVVAKPAIVGVEGLQTNPVAQQEHMTMYYRACDKTPLDGFAWLGDGTWAHVDYDSHQIRVFVDGTPVAILAGERIDAAPN